MEITVVIVNQADLSRVKLNLATLKEAHNERTSATKESSRLPN
jgi:hypothetical protein